MNVKSNLHSFKGYLSISNDVVETDYRLDSIFRSVLREWLFSKNRCSDDYVENSSSNTLFLYIYFLQISVQNYISLQNTLILTITQER